jgi:NADH-quinone oxidoreductase subunit G
MIRVEGQLKPAPWSQVLTQIRKDLKQEIQSHPSDAWIVLSPFLTCEEAFLLSKFVKNLSSGVKLTLGLVPTIGEDDTYPKDRRGNPVQPVKFTIRAEKAPNRRGVEEVLKHYQSEIIPFTQLIESASRDQVKALFLIGGYPELDWLTESNIDALKKIPWIATMDLFRNALTSYAKYVLPAASFAEKEGTFLNHASLAQTIHKCAKSPQECRQDGQVFSDLMDRRGLIQPKAIRKEMASEIPFFASIAEQVPTQGVKLGS